MIDPGTNMATSVLQDRGAESWYNPKKVDLATSPASSTWQFPEIHHLTPRSTQRSKGNKANLRCTKVTFHYPWLVCSPRNPAILSDDAWGVQPPPKSIVFRFHETTLRRWARIPRLRQTARAVGNGPSPSSKTSILRCYMVGTQTNNKVEL